MGTELRRILVNRKEKYLRIEASVTKLEEEVDDLTKRIQHTNSKIDQASNNLKQVSELDYLFSSTSKIKSCRLMQRKKKLLKQSFQTQKPCRPNFVKARTIRKILKKNLHALKVDYQFWSNRFRIEVCNFRNIKRPINV